MADLVYTGNSRARARARRRELAQAAPLLARLDWWMLLAVGLIVGYGPAPAPTIAICAVIENGGHGGTAAAPAALRVLEEYFKKTSTTTSHISD